MPWSHSVDTVTTWFTLECLMWTVASRLIVVTNGNKNLMPTISPFGISDKTLIIQNICTSKEFELYKDFYVHIYIINAELLFFINKSLPLSYYVVSFLLFTILYLFCYIHISPFICCPVSLTLLLSIFLPSPSPFLSSMPKDYMNTQ